MRLTLSTKPSFDSDLPLQLNPSPLYTARLVHETLLAPLSAAHSSISTS